MGFENVCFCGGKKTAVPGENSWSRDENQQQYQPDVQAALRKLEADPCLANRTTLTPAQIADLLDFVLRSTYFQYDGLIYEQQEGAAMGSPVSAVIANLYMEDFEEQALTSTPCMPKIWRRYVDDTFTILSRDKVDIFLQHLNSQQPTIRFTMETETNNIIPFLTRW